MKGRERERAQTYLNPPPINDLSGIVLRDLYFPLVITMHTAEYNNKNELSRHSPQIL